MCKGQRYSHLWLVERCWQKRPFLVPFNLVCYLVFVGKPVSKYMLRKVLSLRTKLSHFSKRSASTIHFKCVLLMSYSQWTVFFRPFCQATVRFVIFIVTFIQSLISNLWVSQSVPCIRLYFLLCLSLLHLKISPHNKHALFQYLYKYNNKII